VELEGNSALETLFRDKQAKAPLLPEVDRNDLIATVLWYIWWERRQATHGDKVQAPTRTAQAISALVLNFSHAKKEEKVGIVRHGWIKPREDYVKLNVDAGSVTIREPGAHAQ
jgi:hypothetical protein